MTAVEKSDGPLRVVNSPSFSFNNCKSSAAKKRTHRNEQSDHSLWARATTIPQLQ
jgi:hypothetical protein